MRIACTGSNGRVGQYLMKRGILPLLCDVTDPVDVDREINRVRPDVILHLAAKSNVNWCDKLENYSSVISINVMGAANVCEMAEKYKAHVVIFSTAHIFDGRKWWGRYKESDEPTDAHPPVNNYGISKLSAESMKDAFENAKVIRTSYLFDYERLKEEADVIMGRNSDKSYPTFLKRSFLYVRHFGEMVIDYAHRYDAMPPVLNLSGADSVSWYRFVKDLAKVGFEYGEKNVRPRRKDLRNGFASRGYNLGLDVSLSKQLGFRQYSYLEGIREMMHGA